ncbi:MAG TPA: glycosyltransferase family 39 protein [Candidatus Polarisedimenticolia bacterium]|nr:glycosyltransferase family 39 protein [Candidatus Polarisedimenticolia bacterium]
MIDKSRWSRGPEAPRLALAASIVVVLACVAAIVSTYGRMSQTWDEPNHIAAGVEWLQDGTYTLWTENPPLARVAVALGPYLSGARLPLEGRGKSEIEADGLVSYALGNGVLYDHGSYRRQLALARLGALPFFLLAAAVLWCWLARLGALSAFMGVAACCTLPAVLAHSGLATTDMPFAAVFLLFMWRLVRWLEEPTVPRAILLGGCLGLAVATKFTAIAFIPPASLAVVCARIWSERRSPQPPLMTWRARALNALLLVAPVGALVVWGAYGFSMGTISSYPDNLLGWVVYGPDAGGLRGALANTFAETLLPAPGFFHGVLALLAHNESGHSAYALGHVSHVGFWYFYPLALIVKTPFPFAVFVAAALVVAGKRIDGTPWWVWGVFGAIPMILLTLLTSHVNIGLRHVLAVYGLAAIGAAAVLGPRAAGQGTRNRRATAACLVILLAWQVAAAGSSYPGFLTYFNPIAADDPGAFLVDSDLDWGQGVFELEEFFSRHDAKSLHIAYNGSARLCDHALPPLHALEPYTPVRGWIAVSELYHREVADYLRAEPPCDLGSLRSFPRAGTGWFAWLRGHEPVAILGHAIRVYYVE